MDETNFSSEEIDNKRENAVGEQFILKGMSISELDNWCIRRGETKFRSVQLYEWMYRHGVDDVDQMTNINKKFRSFLKDNCVLSTLSVETISRSKIEATVKILFRTDDGKYIESVSMIEDERHTVCISSQIGCALNCAFCATGGMGFKRDLSAGEIVDQLIFVRKIIEHPVTNIVFMGMGEPLLNYENVMKAADIFHHERGFHLGSTKITVSTAGVMPKIQQFIKENRRFKLAISLNAANDELRSQIMPINKKWGINELIIAAKEMANKKRRMVLFEYVLLAGVNDSEADAYQLVKLLSGIKCKINLIPYNEVDGKYKSPDREAIQRFTRVLYDNQKGFRVLMRWSKGQDIAAACGQLAGIIDNG